MAEKSREPDYVNDLPDDSPCDTPRCRHEFKYSHQYKEQDVKGRLCGLPVPDDDIGREKQLCYFHSIRRRQGDEAVKGKLEGAIRAAAFVGEAQLLGAPLQRAVLVRANLHSADLFGANLQGADLWRGNLPAAGLYDAALRDACFEFANLRGAELTLADARGANFGAADLRAGELAEAKLQRATLVAAQLQGASLNSAKLDGASLYAARLQGAHLRRAQLVNADLRQVTIASLQEDTEKIGLAITRMADMRDADLRGALLSGATIAPEADLSGATFGFIVARRWWPWQKRGCIGLRGIRRWWHLRNMRWTEYHIRDERCAYSDQEWEKAQALHDGLKEKNPPEFRECEAVYRQLKLNYQESGDYQRAGEFFVREMECKRAQMVVDKKSLWQRIWPALMYFGCGYGERPIWIAAWGLGLIGLFAFIHGAFGLRDSAGSYVMGPGIDWIPSVAGVGRWLTAAYFSVVTFTSLGYGDLAPGPILGRFFAGLEAVLGIVLMSLFLICVVRKYSR